MISFILLSYLISFVNASLNFIEIQPQFEFHDRRRCINVICNASMITDNVSVFFSYRYKNYSVPRTNNVTGVYSGNFSAVSTDQDKVSILCKDSNNGPLLGVKIYFLGYPPSIIPQHFDIDLKCRDYNFHQMVCDLTPGVPEIQRLLGFEEKGFGMFKATLFYSDSESDGILPINSRFDLKDYLPPPTILLHLVIENAIGNITYNFTFDRLDIQKPYEPKIEIQDISKTNFSFIVDMTYFGTYVVSVDCNSLSPLKLSKEFSFNVTRKRSSTKFSDNWPQNSHLLCIFRAQSTLGKERVGQMSDSTNQLITLLEGKPDFGPHVTAGLVDYSSVSENGMLLDITIYYANVPLVHSNGIITQYRWTCDNCIVKNRNISGLYQLLAGSRRSLTLDRAAIGSKFILSACTVQGCCDIPTTFRFTQLKEDPNKRRLSVIRKIDNRNNLTLIWKKEPTSANPLFLLKCSKAHYERDCSSIEMINVTESNGIKTLVVNDSLEWKFALYSPFNDTVLKLKWVSCFYNSISVYEANGKIRNFNSDPFLNVKRKCNLLECEFKVNINLPNCQQFQDLFFYKIFLTYESNNGIQDSRLEFRSSDQVRFILSDLKSGRGRFVANISVTSLNNFTVLWFQKTLITD